MTARRVPVDLPAVEEESEFDAVDQQIEVVDEPEVIDDAAPVDAAEPAIDDEVIGTALRLLAEQLADEHGLEVEEADLRFLLAVRVSSRLLAALSSPGG